MNGLPKPQPEASTQEVLAGLVERVTYRNAPFAVVRQRCPWSGPFWMHTVTIMRAYGPITGRYLHEFLPPELETCWRTVYDAVRKAKAPVRITTKIDFRGKNWLSSEFLVAPLGTSSEPSMLFVTFVAWGEQLFQPPPNADLLHGA